MGRGSRDGPIRLTTTESERYSSGWGPGKTIDSVGCFAAHADGRDGRSRSRDRDREGDDELDIMAR